MSILRSVGGTQAPGATKARRGIGTGNARVNRCAGPVVRGRGGEGRPARECACEHAYGVR